MKTFCCSSSPIIKVQEGNKGLMSHALIPQCLKKLVQVACRVQTWAKMHLSILVEIKNRALTLLLSPWTGCTCQSRGVSGLPALISWWFKYFIVTDAQCRATWSCRVRTVDSQSFLWPCRALCVSLVCVWHCSLAQRGEQQPCCSAWLLSKGKLGRAVVTWPFFQGFCLSKWFQSLQVNLLFSLS